MQFIKNNKKLIIISGILGLILAIYLNNADPVVFREIARWPFLQNIPATEGQLCIYLTVIKTKSSGFPFAIYDSIKCGDSVNILGLITNYTIIIFITILIAFMAKILFLKIKNTNNQG